MNIVNGLKYILNIKFILKQPFLWNSIHHGNVLFNKRSQIIDGKASQEKILCKIQEEVKTLVESGNRSPHLTVVLVGENHESELYIKNKASAATKCGITSDVVRCQEDISQDELYRVIGELNSNDSVDAILLQLPCPDHIDSTKAISSIDVCKDVDGFTPTNIANLVLHGEDSIVPCTALAVTEILNELNIPANTGLRAVVVGCSKYIGLPIFLGTSVPSPESSSQFNFTTTVCHIHTPRQELESIVKESDIVISAVGKPGLIKGECIKPGAIVIDVGIKVVDEPGQKRKILGDIEFEKAKERASYITPVPGGVGPVTVAMLMRNTLLCANLCRKNKSKSEKN